MLSLLFVMGLVASCGGGKEEGGNKAENTPAANEPDLKPVTLTFYTLFDPSGGKPREWFMTNFGDAVVKKFPNVTFDFKFGQTINGKPFGLPEMIAAGDTSVDIVMTSAGSFLDAIIGTGLQYDHKELISKYKYNLSLLEPTTIQLMEELAGGKLYGIPITTATNVLVYNRELFKKFGVNYPKDGMTWDQLYDLAKSMTRTDGGVNYRGFAASIGHIALSNQLSASFIDPVTHEPQFSKDPRWAKHALNLKRFYEIPGNEVDKKTVKEHFQQFTADKVAAMYVNTLGVTILNPETYGIDIDAAQLPEYADLPGIGSQHYPTYLSIINTSKNKEMAFQAIAWLTGEEVQTERARKGYTTILKSEKARNALGEDLPYVKGRNIQAFMPKKPAAPSKLTEYNSMANVQFIYKMEEYLTGAVDLNTMLRQADEVVKTKIAEMKAGK
jgi:multiple sugar transport system substrate-binding protein